MENRLKELYGLLNATSREDSQYSSNMMRALVLANQFIQDVRYPIESRAQVLTNFVEVAVICADMSGSKDEIFARRNELSKDNYFRSVFVWSYLRDASDPHLCRRWADQEIAAGRLPADIVTAEDNAAWDRFFEEADKRELSIEEQNAHERQFERLAKETCEDDIRWDGSDHESLLLDEVVRYTRAAKDSK
ncbi:MAG: hypothetical protein Q8R76_05435 [Candidatus Omnitrophota bacterium]|nr:hypothetical protein [Candidatus Omnitrophota bacterium]